MNTSEGLENLIGKLTMSHPNVGGVVQLVYLDANAAANMLSPVGIADAYLPFAARIWGSAREVGRIYSSLARHPCRSLKATWKGAGQVVKDAVAVPADLWRYWRNGFAPSFDFLADRKKRESHSMAAGEVFAIYGAFHVTQAAAQINDYVQAIGGGFVGGEVATASVMFGTYLLLTGVNNFRHRGGRSVASTLVDTFSEAWGVARKVVPAGLLVFAAIDIPVTAGLVALPQFNFPYLPAFELLPEAAAPIAAGISAAFYAGTAKTVLAESRARAKSQN